jgi:uncharacterized membrane protein YphA (DoxX/SURF4 family)
VNVALWIVASVFAAWCLGSGLTKIFQPKEKLAAGWVWVEDFPPGAIKAIGAVQVVAAFGLILPPLLGMAPALVPLAAVALAALMTGAAIMHNRRNETPDDSAKGHLVSIGGVRRLGTLRRLLLLTATGWVCRPGRRFNTITTKAHLHRHLADLQA